MRYAIIKNMVRKRDDLKKFVFLYGVDEKPFRDWNEGDDSFPASTHSRPILPDVTSVLSYRHLITVILMPDAPFIIHLC